MFNTFTQLFFVDRPENNRITIDGVIANDFDFRPQAIQIVPPSAEDRGINELKALFVEQDARNFYIGIPANINGAENGNSLNGVVIFIDTDFGRRTGLTNFNALNDDSGPATRLLSNSQVEAPPAFGAEIAIASFRGGGLNIAPVAPFVSNFAATPPVGARAGIYRINPAKLNDLSELPGFMAFNASSIVNNGNPADTPLALNNGFEVAIRLDDLFPDFDGDRVPGNNNDDGGVPPQALLGIVAYITSTGETGEVTGAAAQAGGRPAAVGSVKNQILPPQPQLRNNPGQQPVKLLHPIVVKPR
jgi:hypothetical protein